MMLRVLTIFLMMLSPSCYFLGERKFPQKEAASSEGVLGLPLGEKAGGPDEAALAELYKNKSDVPPAAIRPDPDLFARQRLREFREEGKTVAKLIGDIEPYRPLLGGASDDFRTVPAENYDATSLLAMQKVAEEICRALVAPKGRQHPGWETILTAPAENHRENIKSLAQRITGLPSSQISDTTLDALEDLLEQDGESGYEAYVSPCIALMVDASSLLF